MNIRDTHANQNIERDKTCIRFSISVLQVENRESDNDDFSILSMTNPHGLRVFFPLFLTFAR
jgi:hypothetical protein